MSDALRKDLIYLIMQFLCEENYKGVLHTFEKESGVYFDSSHFNNLVMCGKWEDAEKYLSGFTKIVDNGYSRKIYFELRKQKYLEALDKNDRTAAANILVKELKCLAATKEGLLPEMTQLLTKKNLRENPKLISYTNAETERAYLLSELNRLISLNPLLKHKLEFPDVKKSRLKTLMNKSFDWQHGLCKDDCATNGDLKSLLVDHVCKSLRRKSTSLSGSIESDGKFLPLGSPEAGQTSKASTVTATSSAPGETSEAALMEALCAGVSDKFSGESNRTWDEEIPKSLKRIIEQTSPTTSMDFHPFKQTLLLVGDSDGEILLCDVGSSEKFAIRSLQPGFVKNHLVWVKRVLWSDDGNTFGAAFSKDMVQLYRYRGGSDIRKLSEFNAHEGSVNDIAFCKHNNSLRVITCGDDKLIKVWDVASGGLLQIFEGHLAPVTSVCTNIRENIHFILSTSADEKIKGWLFDVARSRVDFDSGRPCTVMSCYSGDGQRLFSCGTSTNGVSHILEWNETEGTVVREYHGRVLKPSICAIQFDIAKNQFLAVGNDSLIKVWDINNVDLLTTIDAEGDLPASPRIRFNKAGSLMAVTAKENTIKILANAEGRRLLQTGM